MKSEEVGGKRKMQIYVDGNAVRSGNGPVSYTHLAGRPCDSGECSLHRRGDDRGMLQRTRRRSGRADAAGSTEKRQTDFPGTHRRTLETSELYAEINRAESGAV